MRRLGRRALVGGGAACLATACLSPTLPLPPPNVPDEIGRVEAGWYVARGRIPKRGKVELRNLRTDRTFGQITLREYEVEFLAEPGDEIQLWYTHGARDSDFVSFEVPFDALPADAGADGRLPGSPRPAGDAGTDAAAPADAPGVDAAPVPVGDGAPDGSGAGSGSADAATG